MRCGSCGSDSFCDGQQTRLKKPPENPTSHSRSNYGVVRACIWWIYHSHISRPQYVACYTVAFWPCARRFETGPLEGKEKENLHCSLSLLAVSSNLHSYTSLKRWLLKRWLWFIMVWNRNGALISSYLVTFASSHSGLLFALLCCVSTILTAPILPET